MIYIEKQEVYPVVCKKCNKVSNYVIDAEKTFGTSYCVLCVTKEQAGIKGNKELSDYLARVDK